MTEIPIRAGDKFRLTNLTGKEAEEFNEGAVVTFVKQTKAFGKIYWRVEESKRKLEIGVIRHKGVEVTVTPSS